MSEASASPLKAYALLAATSLIWGGNAVAGKLAVGHISPLLLTNLRWAMAFVLILSFSTGQIARDWPVLKHKWYIPVLLGFVGYAAFNGLLYSALQHTTALNAVIFAGWRSRVYFSAQLCLLSGPCIRGTAHWLLVDFAGRTADSRTGQYLHAF